MIEVFDKDSNRLGEVSEDNIVHSGNGGRKRGFWHSVFRLKKKKEIGQCAKLELEDYGNDPNKFVLARCECLMDSYLRQKLSNHRWRNISLGVALFLTTLTPVVLIIPRDLEEVRFFAALMSAFAAIATGSLAIYGWHDSFLRHGYAWHLLQHERFLYLMKVGKYSGVGSYKGEDPAKVFAFQLEKIVLNEVKDWHAAMQRIEGEIESLFDTLGENNDANKNDAEEVVPDE